MNKKSVRGLLVVAHGSRRKESNSEVEQLTQQLQPHVTASYDHVATAFLELAEPLIPDGLEQLIAKGCSEIVVFPYFLAAGRHVVTDIPTDVATVTAKYPHVAITMAEHLGAAESLIATIANAVNQR